MWSSISKVAQRKEKKHWATEKPKLDNACGLTGICDFFPDDMEFKDTMKNARKKLEMPLESAMPCKIASRPEETRHAQHNSRKTRYACIIEAHASTRTRIGQTQPGDHEDLIAEKEYNSLSRYSFAQKPIPVPQAMEVLNAKAAVDKKWEKHEKLPAWHVTKVKSKKDVIEKAQKEERTVHIATLMDLCHLKNPGLEQKFQTYEGRVVLQGDVVKDDSGSYAVFKEQGSSASQITAAMFWTLSPDYLDALNKQVTQYPHTPKLRWKALQHC